MTKSGAVWLGLFVLLVFLSELFVFTWSRVECVRTGRLIASEAEEYKGQLALQKKLEIELAHLKSPERLTTIAKRELGLSVPEPGQIISLK
jgi:cell division protein FtsL